jgi:hypothetical protein
MRSGGGRKPERSARGGSEDWRDWSVHVSDDLGDELARVPFSSVLGKVH